MLIEFAKNPGRNIAVIVPMYNEIAGAETCVREILSVLPTLPIPAGLIVVDDGSDDGTGSLLDELRRRLGGFEVVHKVNGGYGSALVRGAHVARASGFDYVLFMDSDLTNPPQHISRFIPAVLRGFDLIKGTRFSGRGDMSTVPWRRRFYSILGNIVARSFFRIGVPDCTNGFRAVRTDLVVGMPLKEPGFAVILEELYWAKRLGALVTSVPTSLTARVAQQRPTMFAYRPRILWGYLRYALRAGLVCYRPRGMAGGLDISNSTRP